MKLVDADIENGRLLEFITGHDTEIQYALGHKEMLEDIFLKYFRTQKIAYNVDKVIKQLEERLCSKKDESSSWDCAARNKHFGEAVKIVKAKGVDAYEP